MLKRVFISFYMFISLVATQSGFAQSSEFTLFNLNSASEADFMTISGVGETMAHEFEEYRPYISIQQFRRDMSKYVSDEQIAEYEEFVYVPIDINAADAPTLTQIPGVNEQIAAAVQAGRPYESAHDFVEALEEFLSHEDAEFAEHYIAMGDMPALFTLLNLNTAPEADFLTVPGVGETMAHEFEEYRPYISIQQFRRDMGKYVDDETITGYENFVFVPIDVDAADSATLQQIPAIDATIADALIAARPFESNEAFLSALAEYTAGEEIEFATNYLAAPAFTLLNLNTTAEADFTAVPGVGETMAHEFEEYRPYISIQQFRRNMAKYVDDEAIAGYEQFVFVPIDVNAADAATLMQLPGVDDHVAEELAEYRPYDSLSDFLEELGEWVAGWQAEYGANMVMDES